VVYTQIVKSFHDEMPTVLVDKTLSIKKDTKETNCNHGFIEKQFNNRKCSCEKGSKKLKNKIVMSRLERYFSL